MMFEPSTSNSAAADPTLPPDPEPSPSPSSSPGPAMVYVSETPCWEYKVLVAEGSQPAESELNALGRKGWELCAVVTQAGGARYVFKRLAE